MRVDSRTDQERDGNHQLIKASDYRNKCTCTLRRAHKLASTNTVAEYEITETSRRQIGRKLFARTMWNEMMDAESKSDREENAKISNAPNSHESRFESQGHGRREATKTNVSLLKPMRKLKRSALFFSSSFEQKKSKQATHRNRPKRQAIKGKIDHEDDDGRWWRRRRRMTNHHAD